MDLFTRKSLFFFLQQFMPTKPTIVEAGAFDGKDTKQIACYWPQATIHAFEPVQNIFEVLTHNTIDIPTIMRYRYALSNTTGTSLFYCATKPSQPDKICQAGSLLPPKERLSWSSIIYPHTEYVRTITLDAWANLFNIKQIDFLWLDTQGCTLPILQAACNMLKTIQVLYLEVEFIEAYKGQAQYRDIQTWLTSQGFTEIGRDFTNTSDWFFGNVVFIKQGI